MENKVRQIFEDEASAIKNIPVTDSYKKAVEIIHHHVHVKKGKLITAGMGKAGQIAHNIATTFSSTGTPAAFLHPSTYNSYTRSRPERQLGAELWESVPRSLVCS